MTYRVHLYYVFTVTHIYTRLYLLLVSSFSVSAHRDLQTDLRTRLKIANSWRARIMTRIASEFLTVRCCVRVACRHRGHRNQRAIADARRRELERRRRRRARHSEDGKKRRSLNVADPGREKFAQLYSIRQNSVVEITPDGNVQTATNKSSIYCTFSSLKAIIIIISIHQMVVNIT